MTPPEARSLTSLSSIRRAMRAYVHRAGTALCTSGALAVLLLVSLAAEPRDAMSAPTANEPKVKETAQEQAQEKAPATTPDTSNEKTGEKTGGKSGESTGDGAKPTEEKPAAQKTDTAPPKPVIAVFQCESGIFKVELALKQAPRLCANFINLANRGYFNGQQWIDFSPVVRQTGANPGGDPAYTLPREFSKDLFFDAPGRLCFSNDSDDVSKARAKPTRIFVTVKPQDRWNLQYSAIGTVTEGLEFVARMTPGERIVRVVIEGDVTAHQARYAKQIAEWNRALDAVGLVEKR